MSEEIRRVAANQVILGDTTFNQCIVEIVDERVVNYYCFEDEMPLTEWLGGIIELRHTEDGTLKAYKNGKVIK